MSSAADTYRKIQDVASILEKIGHNYPPSSEEYTSLRMAGLAYAFAILRHEEEFERHLAETYKPFSASKAQFLKKLGFE